IDGPQIAIVTGPPGEEIFCDEHGRVRVKFAWDRYNKADNYSSCWIRVSQAWAGTGFGNIAIPRVGQEVIVDFLNGDPDQPIITGRTYHASNRSPGSLPGTKTQMAIRSQTYKGNGYNELMFEDATRQELLSMHAQKDMRVTILHDLTASIKNDEKRRIDGKRTTHVVKDEHVYVEGEKRDHFVKDYSLSLDQQFHLKVGDAMLAEAGKEFHFKSGSKIVLESGCEITLKAGSTFIKLDPSGVTLSPMLNVGAGIPGRGSGWAGQFPDQLTGNHDASPASAPPPFSPLIMSDNQRQSLQNEEPFCEECEKCKQQGGCSI
ncbi:type VI secretion system Vgr family protein, partial [Rahnella inusitata]|uniref:type VI secretion system Vgr family protein n=1 Tax=Rahnella inusitata TaxID=58169 RepID=UPI0039B08806